MAAAHFRRTAAACKLLSTPLSTPWSVQTSVETAKPRSGYRICGCLRRKVCSTPSATTGFIRPITSSSYGARLYDLISCGLGLLVPLLQETGRARVGEGGTYALCRVPKLRRDHRGLLEGNLPGAVSAEADAGAAVIVGESFAVEGAGALQTVEDDGGVIAEHFDL